MHCLHTIVGRCLSILSDTVSGAIAFALAQKPAGAVDTFRSALKIVLRQSVDVVHGGLPPRPDADITEYRAAFLDCFIQGRPGLTAKRRRLILERRVRDDWQSDRLVLYVRAGASPEEVEQEMEDWAEDVSEALAPTAVKVFARSRWCTSGATAADLFLLCTCHNLAARAIPVWIQLLGGKIDSSIWDDLGDIVLESLEGEQYWAAFNDKQRGDALRFARAPTTTANVVLWHKCMIPSVILMDRCLHQASEEWNRSQAQDGSISGDRKYVILECMKGNLTAGFFSMIISFMFGASQWTFLPKGLRTMAVASLAFAMLARSLGGVDFHISGLFAAYPYRL